VKILVTFVSPSFTELTPREVLKAIREIDRGGHQLDFIWLTGVPLPNQGDANLGYNLERARQIAINLNYDYMLIIESDVIVPKDCLLKLLKMKCDVAIGLTPERYEKVRTFFPLPCMKWNDNPDALSKFLRNKIFKIKGAGGLNLNLVKRRVFKVVPFPVKFPCDFTWYASLRKRGFKVLCNPEVRTYHVERCGRIARGLETVLNYWKKRIRLNELQGKAWYHSLPNRWWWGLSSEEFLEELPKHLNNEELWFPTLQEFEHVELGGGGNPRYHPNLDAVQNPKVDYVINLNEEDLPFFDATVKHIYASHFLEHLSYKRAIELLKDCYRVLKVGGYIELVLPDMEKGIINNPEMTSELSRIIFGERTNEFQYHRSWFSQDLVKFILEEIGFNDVEVINERKGREPCFTIVGFKREWMI